jgi:hypothetical protein
MDQPAIYSETLCEKIVEPRAGEYAKRQMDDGALRHGGC